MLSDGCLTLKEYRRNSDLTEDHCRQRCLSLPGCKAFQYSTERDPNCKLFAHRSGDIGICQMSRSFDWKLLQLRRGCRDRKFQHFNFFTQLSSGYIWKTSTTINAFFNRTWAYFKRHLSNFWGFYFVETVTPKVPDLV